MAKGIHLFPFRTEKLSPLAPMVLPTGGRVGRCRIQMERVTEMWLSLFLSYLSCLVFSSLFVSFRLVCCVRVVFSFLWCGALVFLFLCFLLLFSVFCCFLRGFAFFSLLYSLLHSLLSPLLCFFVIPFFLFVPFQPCCGSLLSACLACFCLPDLSFSLFIFFFCACVCWIRFGYLLLNLFCFDIKL